MMAILFAVGCILLILALNITGFFKIVLWAASVCLMVYTLPEIGWMSNRPYSEQINSSIFFVGLMQVLITITEHKFFGIVLWREVTDFVINILGYVLIVVGLVRECWM